MNTVAKLKCGVIGVGYLGRFHAQKYQLIERAQLVGVYDRDSARASVVAQELSVKSFKSLEELVSQVEAVTISATTSSHYELAKFCLERGIHVHVEKPMTSTSKQGEELVAIAKKNSCKLQVGHIERFNPAFQVARDRLNRPLFIECHRLAPFNPRGSDVTVVLDLMIHDIDVVLALVRSKVTSVSAVGAAVLTPTVDIANARIEFASGAIANLTASRVSQLAMRKFRVFEKNQYLSFDFGSGEVKLATKSEEGAKPGNLPIVTETWNLQKGDALLEETKAFVEAVTQNQPCIVAGEDGLVALRLAEQISSEIQKRI